MLKIISLHTINEIFETEALGPLSPMAKMSYISCLTYWFKDMPPDMDSNKGFDIVKAQIRSFEKNYKYFEEMQRAGLVTINAETITFNNHWNRHIDKTLLNKPSPEVFLGTCDLKPAKDYEADLQSSQSVFELLGARYNIKAPEALRYMADFVKECDATGAKYINAGQFIKHFLNSMNKKVQFKPKPGAASGGGKLHV